MSIDGQDQTAAGVCWQVRAAIEPGAVPARLVVQQPARRMGPRHEPVVDQQVAMAVCHHSILVSSASQPEIECQMRQVSCHGRSQGFGQEIGPDHALHLGQGHGLGDLERGRLPPRPVLPGPFSTYRERGVLADRIMDGSHHHLTPHRRGRHDSEQRQARREILCSIYWIDDEGQVGCRHLGQQTRVSPCGLLSDDQRRWVGLAQARSDLTLGRLISVGHDRHPGC